MSGLVQWWRRRRRRITGSAVVDTSGRPIGLILFTRIRRTEYFVPPTMRRGDSAVNTSVADDNSEARKSTRIVSEWDGYWAEMW